MSCNNSPSNINIPVSPSIPLPGFSSAPTAPINSPLVGFTDLSIALTIEDLNDLINKLKIIWPTGTMQPNVDGALKTILDGVINLFNQLGPFLSLYKFITPIFNLITCVIEVLCALPNPFAVTKKLIKLFSECLPPFIALLPFAALPIMILSILLLVLALVEYLILTISQIILDLLNNLKDLSAVLTLHNNNSIEAITNKINILLCDIQNLFACLVALNAIMSIVKSLALLVPTTICDDGDQCCNTEVCPNFISQNPNGLTGGFGKLIYYNKVTNAFQQTIRSESWQFFDSNDNQDYHFADIINPTPEQGNIFFPEGVNYSSETNFNQAPYTVDLVLILDPKDFHPTDTLGKRSFTIKNCIVIQKPYLGVLDYQDKIVFNTNYSGTLLLQGGSVIDDTINQPYLINDLAATLNTFLHISNQIAGIAPNNPIIIENISFTLKINHPILASQGLITYGCIPKIAVERQMQNAIIINTGLSKLPNVANILPNINLTQQCLQDSLDRLRSNISASSVSDFQITSTQCLADLQNQTSLAFCQILIAATSLFQSSFIIDTDFQFTTRAIVISVILKDNAGIVLSNNLPLSCSLQIQQLLQAKTTFGQIGNFTYDGLHSFTTILTSNQPGSGQVSISFQGSNFARIFLPTSTETSKIVEIFLPFSFIGEVIQSASRRGPEDIVLAID